ncbi:hypothetical protein [Bradyrhizobium sp.]|uniref:hypothetical protein n=1 Tax=Bradyrhizobium sp. TaxID=376 RepID=UPI0025C03A0A|nr:hypothetical protein [Bradyrhizobium sp.]
MPSPRNQSPQNRRFDWPGILRILLVQVLVLAALMVAFVRYVNWSSDQAWAEFSRTFMAPAPDAKPEPNSAAPMRAVKSRIPCPRRV